MLAVCMCDMRCTRPSAAGLGFECVSLQEVQTVRKLFPTLAPQLILFTPNFIGRTEYVAALEA